jgi:hypothetical protein
LYLIVASFDQTLALMGCSADFLSPFNCIDIVSSPFNNNIHCAVPGTWFIQCVCLPEGFFLVIGIQLGNGTKVNKRGQSVINFQEYQVTRCISAAFGCTHLSSIMTDHHNYSDILAQPQHNHLHSRSAQHPTQPSSQPHTQWRG